MDVPINSRAPECRPPVLQPPPLASGTQGGNFNLNEEGIGALATDVTSVSSSFHPQDAKTILSAYFRANGKTSPDDS